MEQKQITAAYADAVRAIKERYWKVAIVQHG